MRRNLLTGKRDGYNFLALSIPVPYMQSLRQEKERQYKT